MNIIKSSYNINTLKEFKKQELKKIGKNNYDYILKVEKLVDILLYILIILTLFSLVIPAIIFKDNVIAVPLSLSLVLIWVIIIWKVLDCDKNGINNITVKIMKKKDILYSPILNKNFDFIYKNYETLIKICEFLDKHPNAAFKYNYAKNDWIYLVYNDGNYIKEEIFSLNSCFDRYLFKEDKIDCSFLDKYIKKFLEYNQ